MAPVAFGVVQNKGYGTNHYTISPGDIKYMMIVSPLGQFIL